VNITINDLGPCKKLLRIELTEAEVEEKFVAVEAEFCKHANLPGFRRGKAPKPMVLRSYEKPILEETQHKVVGENFREAVKQKELAVYALLDVEEPHLERGKPAGFTATVEVMPQFDLPNYRGLVAKREDRGVGEADIDHAIEMLRARLATFQKIDRPAAEGDIVVVNYTGACDGKPIAELAPASRGLATQQNFWVEIRENAFLPGFAQQLAGATTGTKRTVQVDFPADFPTPAVAGKRGLYEVEVVEVKERILPALDDTFAKSWEATSVQTLREGVRQDLQNELNDKLNRSVREQIVRALLAPISFDLPESAVLAETRNVVYEIVRENQQHGVSKEIIDKNKDGIYGAANVAAKDRVKARFVFQKIAEKEGIKVAQNEFDARLFAMAKAMKMSPEKLFKELQERNGTDEVIRQILNEKVVDFLQLQAKIEDVAPDAAPAAPTAPPA
jgi:trigger factor